MFCIMAAENGGGRAGDAKSRLASRGVRPETLSRFLTLEVSALLPHCFVNVLVRSTHYIIYPGTRYRYVYVITIVLDRRKRLTPSSSLHWSVLSPRCVPRSLALFFHRFAASAVIIGLRDRAAGADTEAIFLISEALSVLDRRADGRRWPSSSSSGTTDMRRCCVDVLDRRRDFFQVASSPAAPPASRCW